VSEGSAVTGVSDPTSRVSAALATRTLLRREQGELCVADRDDRPQGVGQRGDAGARARDGGRELLLRLAELRLGGGLGLAGREDRVILRLHLQRDVEALRHLVRLRGANVGACAPDLAEPATTVEQVDRRVEPRAVGPGIRCQIGDEAALCVEAVARLVHLAETQVHRGQQGEPGGANARLRGAELSARLNGAEGVLLSELDGLGQRNGARRERVDHRRRTRRPRGRRRRGRRLRAESGRCHEERERERACAREECGERLTVHVNRHHLQGV
jgi:hypothetical protein